MATELKRAECFIPRHELFHEAVLIDAVDMANIERAVAEGAGDVDRYSPTGSDDLDEAKVRTMIMQALIAAKEDEAKLYAFLTVGCLVTIQNLSLLAAPQVAAWKKAVDDYRGRHCGHA